MPRSFLDLRTATGSLLAGVVLGLGGSFVVLGVLLVRSLLGGATHATLRSSENVAEPSRELRDRHLEMPARGVARESLTDTFESARALGRVHHALDIMAPRGTPVVASDDGTVARLDSGGAGGTSVYQYDGTTGYCFYYAHLDGYAPGLAAGQSVARGQLLGFVGSTGNASASAPHLHFAITEIDPATKSCHGRDVNPYPLLH